MECDYPDPDIPDNLADTTPECYHKHCWEEAGDPCHFKSESEHAADQGYFFDDEHNLTKEEVDHQIENKKQNNG